MLIFIVGYMGCGKSTIGRKLAKELALPLFDTDKLIVEQYNMSVVDLFAERGEQEFRAIESAMIKRVAASQQRGIVSTGGGAPTWDDNMEVMNSEGLTIYLDRSPANIARRLSPYGREKRPKLRGLNDDELLEFMTRDLATRVEHYRKAKLVIDVNSMSDGEIVDYIKVVYNSLNL